MEIILLEDVPNVGRKYEEHEVADGYGANFLVPNGKAVVANEDNRNLYQKKKAEAQAEREKAQAKKAEQIADLEGESITISALAGDQGQLFSGIYASDIAEKMTEEFDVEIVERDVALDQPLQRVGDHEVEITVADTTVEVTVSIEGEIHSDETDDEADEPENDIEDGADEFKDEGTIEDQA